MWNMALGEALYPLLQCLEVGLRNALNASIATIGGDRWFEDPNIVVDLWAQKKVLDAKTKLTKQVKALDPGRIVAALEFGVWVSFFHVQYEQKPQPSDQKPLWPNLWAPRVHQPAEGDWQPEGSLDLPSGTA
jgi:hypothetical protein